MKWDFINTSCIARSPVGIKCDRVVLYCIQTNSSVHNINTRNKDHLHRPVANLSCFQKGASYSVIRIFNSLTRSIKNLKNEKTQFKVALKKFLNAHSFYSVDERFTCTNDMYCWLYDCVNVSYTVIFLLFVCLRHVPHPIVLWLSRIYGMYICMYVLLMYTLWVGLQIIWAGSAFSSTSSTIGVNSKTWKLFYEICATLKYVQNKSCRS